MKVIEMEKGEYVVLAHVTSFTIEPESVQVRMVSGRAQVLHNHFDDKDVQARIERISTELRIHFEV